MEDKYNFTSSIALFAFEPDSPNWVKCDGRTMGMENGVLVSLMFSRYGDGLTMPDLRGKSPVPGMEYYICVQGLYPPRP